MINNCFVIMGFGKKVCPNSSKIIDLDITYNELIKPTMLKLKINCIRTDEVINNKSIDADLFQLLYMSDLVVADISTLNSNTIYELGIRHALKPFSTIIIAEKDVILPFDINHLRIHMYQHDGNTISNTEIYRLSQKLTKIINHLNQQEHPDIDSPLYNFLNINPPTEIDKSLFNKLSDKLNHTESIYKLISKANAYKDSSNFLMAEEYFNKVFHLTKDEYILKELAVCIYKQNEKDIFLLQKAENLIVDYMKTYLSQNSELISALGAIYKRKWYITNNISDLNNFIDNYKKSYQISNHFYPGGNYAYGLMVLAYCSKNIEEKITNYFWSKKIYKEVINLCKTRYDANDYWINATLQEAYLAINDLNNFDKYTILCNKLLSSTSWEKESTLKQINNMKTMLKEFVRLENFLNTKS